MDHPNTQYGTGLPSKSVLTDRIREQAKLTDKIRELSKKIYQAEHPLYQDLVRQFGIKEEPPEWGEVEKFDMDFLDRNPVEDFFVLNVGELDRYETLIYRGMSPKKDAITMIYWSSSTDSYNVHSLFAPGYIDTFNEHGLTSYEGLSLREALLKATGAMEGRALRG